MQENKTNIFIFLTLRFLWQNGKTFYHVGVCWSGQHWNQSGRIVIWPVTSYESIYRPLFWKTRTFGFCSSPNADLIVISHRQAFVADSSPFVVCPSMIVIFCTELSADLTPYNNWLAPWTSTSSRKNDFNRRLLFASVSERVRSRTMSFLRRDRGFG